MRNFLTTKDLVNAGAEKIGHIKFADWFVGKPSAEITERPGFYFIADFFVEGRFFVGNQRSKTGFENVLSQLRRERSNFGKLMSSSASVYAVYWLPANKMKPLTTGFEKGQIAMSFTRQHKSDAQTYSELNRLLNDNFKFVCQKY